jgi:ABC-type sugar transport system permease subunit
VSLRLVIGFALAVFIESRIVRRLRMTVPLRMAMLLPWATPDIVAVTVWKQIFDGRTGVINRTLVEWGIIDQPIVFLAEAAYVWPSVITIIIWNGSS